jgi:hypothetical protein
MKKAEKKLREYQKTQKKLAAELSDIGFIWQGSIQWQRLTCGKPNCPCSTNPRAKHGPYPYWTSKKNNRTVSKLLKPEEVRILEEWVNNRKKMDAVIREMKKLSKSAFGAALELSKKGEKN